MKDIRDHRIVQIDITNKCNNLCNNCTHFCGHFETIEHMPADTFRLCLESLASFDGIVGIIGGEPTLHPDFKLLLKIMRQLRPENPEYVQFAREAKTYFGHYNKTDFGTKKCGLWTANLEYYYKNYEELQDTFGFQIITDHAYGGTHIPILLSRKELGIPDDEWVKLRDNCWLQNNWSPSISKRGGFFCEVAAAMDLLYRGPGGWPIEEFINKKVADFEDQLHWCELCSACLAVPHQPVSSTEPDLVTPILYEKLKMVNSPKLKQGRVALFDITQYDKTKYEPEQQSCVRNEQASTSIGIRGVSLSRKMTYKLTKKHVTALIICKNYSDYLSIILPHNKQQVDRLIVITDKDDLATFRVCAKHKVEVFLSKRLHRDNAILAKGAAYNECIEAMRDSLDWLLFTDADIVLPHNFKHLINSYMLHKNMLYYCTRWQVENQRLTQVALKHFFRNNNKNFLYKDAKVFKTDSQTYPLGYFQLVNINAKQFKEFDHVYPEISHTAAVDDYDFGYYVFKDACVCLPEEINVFHLPHSKFVKEDGENWYGRKTPAFNKIVPELFE